MAVTLTPADLTYPAGQLQEGFFPDDDLQGNLVVWLAEAKDKVADVVLDQQDDAAAAWVYYRAYQAVARRIGAQPSRESYGGAGGGSNVTRDWGQNKSDYWEGLADEQLALFQGYVHTSSGGTVTHFTLAGPRR